MECDICTCNELVTDSFWLIWSRAIAKCKTTALWALAIASAGAAVYFWFECRDAKKTLDLLREEYRTVRRDNKELKAELDNYGKGADGVGRELKKTQQMNKRMCSALKNMATVEGRARQETENFRTENQSLRHRLQEVTCRLQEADCRLNDADCRLKETTSRLHEANRRLQKTQSRIPQREDSKRSRSSWEETEWDVDEVPSCCNGVWNSFKAGHEYCLVPETVGARRSSRVRVQPIRR